MTVKKNHKLLDRAKTLRRNLTRQERHLWYDFLRQYPVKVYKQRIVENYIVDFYCHSAKLVIEVDGSQHFMTEGQIYDVQRTDTIQKHGLYVLRFSNKDVDERFEEVCAEIDRVIKERTRE